MTNGDRAVVKETIDSYIEIEEKQIDGFLQRAEEARIRGDVEDYDDYHGMCTKHRYAISVLKMVCVSLGIEIRKS